jgi:hypothetical protein
VDSGAPIAFTAILYHYAYGFARAFFIFLKKCAGWLGEHGFYAPAIGNCTGIGLLFVVIRPDLRLDSVCLRHKLTKCKINKNFNLQLKKISLFSEKSLDKQDALWYYILDSP